MAAASGGDVANIPVREQREALLRSFKRQYLGKGYIEDDWEGFIGGKHLDAAFTTFMNCGTAKDKKQIQDCVREGLLTGNLIRYEVYDDSFARQGEALLEITEVDHVRDGHILCRGRHLAASDPEYHEWALRHMSDVEKPVSCMRWRSIQVWMVTTREASGSHIQVLLGLASGGLRD